MLDPKYVLNKGELSSLSARSYLLRSVRVFGLKDRASISRILRQIEKNAKGKKLLIYGILWQGKYCSPRTASSSVTLYKHTYTYVLLTI